MSEETRRLRYAKNRILIEVDRILSPQFDDAVVYLSGAQIELLRNVTHYLNRPSTYVAEYESGSYLMPTDADWDTLAGIVHDLEETLMGNPNTIWGYESQWFEAVEETSVGGGVTWVDTTPVPAGYVHVLERWRVQHDGGTALGVTVRFYSGTAWQYLYDVPALPHIEDAYDQVRVTLNEGDIVRFLVTALPVNKIAELTVSGYKMVVPE